MRARLLIAMLASVAVVCAGLAAVPNLGLASGPEPVPATGRAVTPVFSVRRVAGAVTRTVAGARLAADLEGVLDLPVYAQSRAATCLSVHDAEGRVVYSRETATPLIPASTMKMVTGAVALDRLGADTRYVTPVRASGPPQEGAVGDLWFVGSGDPLLATADFAAVAGWLEGPRIATPIETLADRIVAAGVRRVGRVMGDESRYDTQRYVPTWEPNYATDPDIGPQSALNLNGGFVQWRPRAIPATAPATSAAAVLADLLRARGVTVGGAGEGKAPEPGVTIAQIESPPMAEVVGVVLRESDNLAAELVVKELGARFGGAGTTAAGVGVVTSSAAAMGLPVGALASADGSGLDRSDRLSCDLLHVLLARAGEDGPLAKGLPIAGSTGTLTKRFVNTPAAGKVRAKTGSLAEVTGLSGWATALDGRSLEFAMIANDLPFDAAGTALQDRVVTVLAGYPRAPAADEIGPEPVRPVPG